MGMINNAIKEIAKTRKVLKKTKIGEEEDNGKRDEKSRGNI